MADSIETTGMNESAGTTTGMAENLAAVDDSVLVGAEGQVTAVGQADLGETVEVTDESQEIAVDPGDDFVLPEGIASGDIQYSQFEGSLVIVLPSGSEITFTDFFVIASQQEEGGLPPVLTLADGTVMDPPLVIAQIADFDPNAVEAAAGGGGGTGGNASFSPYASGDIGPGDAALDLLGNLPGFPFDLGNLEEEFLDEAGGLFQVVTALSQVVPVGLPTDLPSSVTGVISGDFDGGFEDALPNQHLGAVDAANETKTQLVIEFVPDDDEVVESFTVEGIPLDVRIFIRPLDGGADVELAHDGSVTVPGSLLNNIFLIPPEDNDADIPLSFSAVVVDPQNPTNPVTLTGTFTVVIDAVADVPSVGSTGTGGGFVAGAIPSVEGEAGGTVAVNLDVVSNDIDGSETTAVQLFFSSPQNFTAADFDVIAVGAELVVPEDGSPPFWVVPQEGFAGLQIVVPESATETVDVFAFGVATETLITGEELTFDNNQASTKKAVAFQIALEGELIVNIGNPTFLETETDDVLTISFADLQVSATLGGAGRPDLVESVTATFENLPDGAVILDASGNVVATASGGTISVTAPSLDDFNALTLQLPADFATPGPGGVIDPGDISGTVVVESPVAVLNPQPGSIAIDVAVEGDIDVTAAPETTAEDQNLATISDGAGNSVTLNVVVLNLAAVATDADGSETVQTATVTFNDVPAGTGVLFFGTAGATIATVERSVNPDGTEDLVVSNLSPAELATLRLGVPEDYSGTITGNVVSAFTDEQGEDSATFMVVVTPTPDLVLPSENIGGSGLDQETDQPITVDLNLSAAITDGDGSEVLTSITVTFDQLPAGTTTSGGTLTGLVWSGTQAELSALALTFPTDYSSEDGGVINGSLRVTTDEGGDQTVGFTVPVLPEEDLDVVANDVTVPESDTGVTVNLSLSATVTDQDGSEVVDSVTVTFTGLPAGSSVNGGTLVGGVWSGTAVELAALQLTLPASFTGDITGLLNATSDEGGNESAPFTITVDAMPDVIAVDDVTVDEDGFETANLDDSPLRPGEVDSTESTTGTGTITVDFEADVPATLDGSLRLLDSPALDGQLTTLDGGSVSFTSPDGGLTLVGTVPDGEGTREVLTIAVQTGASASGTEVTYTYVATLNEPLEHPDPEEGGNTENTLTLSGVGFVATDSDGDPTPAASFDVTIVDDIPLAVNDATTTAEDTQVTYNVITNTDGTSDASGADAPLTLVSAGLSSGSGSVSFASNGDVTFTPANGFEGDAVIAYTIEDQDGDRSSATLTVTVGDDSTPIVTLDEDVTVDEDGLSGANLDGTPLRTGEVDSTEDDTATGTIKVDYLNAADVPGTPDGSLKLLDSAALDGQLTTLDGLSVSFALDGDQKLVGSVTDGQNVTREVLTIEVQTGASASGTEVTYTYVATLTGPRTRRARTRR